MTLQDIEDVKNEAQRFSERLLAAVERIKKDPYALYGCKETAALKRAGLDLKNELTKLNK